MVVEGGPKAIKFYKNLMLKRISWHTFLKKKEIEDANGNKVEEIITKTV